MQDAQLTRRERGRRGAALLVMLSGNAAQSLVFCIPPPLLPAMARSFNATNHGMLLAQLITPVAALGMMMGAAVSGVLLSGFGVRLMIICSSLAVAALGSLPLWAGGAGIIILSRLFLGVVSGVLLTASTVLVAKTYSGDAQQRVIGYQASYAGWTFLATILLSGEILQLFGWRAPFAIYAVFGVMVAALTSASIAPAAADRNHGGKTGAKIFSRLWPIYAAILALGVLITIPGVQLPFLLAERGTNLPLAQSLIVGIATLFSAIASFVYGRLRARTGPRLIFALGLSSSALGLLIIGLAPAAAAMAAGNCLVGFGMGLFIPYLIGLTMQNAPASVVGHAIGLAVSIMFLGSFLNPFVMGFLKLLFGAGGAFDAFGILTLAAAAACMFIRKGLLVGTSAGLAL